jgi:serine/threonine protein kinase
MDELDKISCLFDNHNNKNQENKVDLTTDFKQNYLVGKIIGEGAYASVRVAIYKPTNTKVAIKVYEKNKIKEVQKKKSVRREIIILQNLNHPNILKILDVV